ncbi:MAG: 16S rRNA (uracil(1498)-N(3))-methyltransferase [Bacteroidales bacterium]|nr:16S rRNA (uracil(1498)-N(3))-methyltransferase [Bacteroidales bacterium]MCF8387394.1 16S rRNA (uracil(1498)-N(3))-methyltransferase [Bacteroidales bacterium]MCF8398680.1 16S rRNA (uracil(1498)-N(3))-methyltransferase [Bacteroidales bacterium]
MQLFYTTNFKGNHAILDANDSRHVIKVLRMGKGDEIHFTDGKGNLYTGQIEEESHKKCMLQITGVKKEFGKRDYHLHLAVAPTKNISRYEWLLEKATEIGVDEITPIICRHSERAVVKTDRLERVMIAAMKQSLKAYLPAINEAVKFEDFIERDHKKKKYIAFIDDGVKNHLKDLYENGEDCLILIGPEGDFSREEFEQAKEKGFVPISLGKSRLRTETAGVVACHTVQIINN